MARVVSVQGGTSNAAIGVMIRELTAAGSTNIKLADYPAYHNFYLELRSSTGGSTTAPSSVSGDTTVLGEAGAKREFIHELWIDGWCELDSGRSEPNDHNGDKRGCGPQLPAAALVR